MLSPPSSVPYAPLRLPLRRSPFRLAAYRRPRSDDCVAAGRRRLSPVLTPALSPFRATYAGGFLDAASPGASRRPWPSPVLARLGSPLLPLRGYPIDAAGFAPCYGLVSCSTPYRAFVTALRRSALAWRRPSATGRPGPYPDRIFTDWSV